MISRGLLFAALAGGGLAVDLWTKDWIFARLGPPGGRTEWLIQGNFGWQTSLNQGALFGMGQGNVWLFATLSIAAAVGIVIWLFGTGAAADRTLTVALGSIMGGICGNLYDRLGLWWTPEFAEYPQHAVRDWILLQYGNWPWPNFNVADMLLVGGAGLLMLHAWRHPEPSPSVPARA